MTTRRVLIGSFLMSLGLLVAGPGVQTHEPVAWAGDAPDLQTVTLQVDGITCGACVKEIRSALLKVPGVKTVEFQLKKKWFVFHDYSDARVIITCEPGTTTASALMTAVESASSRTSTYKAKPLS